MAEKKAVSDAPMRIRSPLRSILKVTGFAADTASSLVSVILRLVGTVLLIVLITGILFSCIFAYYVKTCLTPDLDITLEDYQLSEASTERSQHHLVSGPCRAMAAGYYHRGRSAAHLGRV